MQSARDERDLVAPLPSEPMPPMVARQLMRVQVEHEDETPFSATRTAVKRMAFRQRDKAPWQGPLPEDKPMLRLGIF